MSFAQEARKTWNARVMKDSLNVENIMVFNTSSRTSAITDNDGYFKILARANDTLVLSGWTLKSRKIVLKETDNPDNFKVKMEPIAYELTEVVVKKGEKKKKVKNSQAIVDQQYADDEKSSPNNIAMPNYDAIPNGVNFVRLYKDIAKLVRRNRPEEVEKLQFSESVLKKFDYNFFHKTLNLKDEEIKLFVMYCETDPKVKDFTVKETKFGLMDFMISKNEEFKKMVALGK
ncbi:hypothetical protein FNO01nite_01860 [Flavobacterium noncentrifugens]|nr:hypothetical protein FNO01nite_01860 [Flavobacterium noncentrifugens]